MDAMLEALIKGSEKYYNTVTKVGYINNKIVNNFIVASWIYDVLSGKYGVLVNDEEYTILNKLYNCLEGSCLVPYQKYCKEITVNKLPDNKYIRVTEADRLNRFLEINEDLRMI